MQRELLVGDLAPSFELVSNTGENAELVVEALLFAAAAPLSLEQLARLLKTSREATAEAVELLTSHLRDRAIRVIRNGDVIELVTAPGLAPYVSRLFDEPQRLRLSHAALETLAIVAYRQPATRAQIDAIRGVSSDRALSTLMSHDLIEDAGRLETVGRPLLYRTTLRFLERLGLSSLEDLPALDPALAHPESIARSSSV